MTLTSRPFEISSSSFSGGGGYTSGSFYFTSPLDLTTTAARITVSPPINAGTVVVSNSGCGNSGYSNAAGTVNFGYGCLTYSPYTCGSPFLTGTAYTIIIPVTVQNLSGQNLSKAYTYFNNPL